MFSWFIPFYLNKIRLKRKENAFKIYFIPALIVNHLIKRIVCPSFCLKQILIKLKRRGNSFKNYYNSALQKKGYTVSAVHPSFSVQQIVLVEILMRGKFHVFYLKNEQLYWILAIFKNFNKKKLYCWWYIILAR